jgi:hypothetical protein
VDKVGNKRGDTGDVRDAIRRVADALGLRVVRMWTNKHARSRTVKAIFGEQEYEFRDMLAYQVDSSYAVRVEMKFCRTHSMAVFVHVPITE